MTRIASCFIAAGLCLLAPAAARAAESYPNKPLRMVITFPPGGPTDFVVRMITQRLTENWGHPVIIDNRGGAPAASSAPRSSRAPRQTATPSWSGPRAA